MDPDCEGSGWCREVSRVVDTQGTDGSGLGLTFGKEVSVGPEKS